MTIQEAERLLQRAYNIDVGQENGVVSVDGVSAMDLHKVFYDGGLSGNPEIQDLLRQGGALRSLIEYVIGVRVQNGEYTEKTLRKMYFGG